MLMLSSSAGHSGSYRVTDDVNALTLHFCRYDAHPMAILTSAFAYLGSYYREANPSLQGSSRLRLFDFGLLTFVYNRPDPIYQRRQCISCDHGQANLSVNRQGHYSGCVSFRFLPIHLLP